jgi:hypothetical protein
VVPKVGVVDDADVLDVVIGISWVGLHCILGVLGVLIEKHRLEALPGAGLFS